MLFSKTMPNGFIFIVLEVCVDDLLFVSGLLLNLEVFLKME
jgi:hypothetical protein